jgi:hypothetical protein
MEASDVGSSHRLRLGLSVVGGFVFGGRGVPDGGVELGGVEPFHVLGGGSSTCGRLFYGPCRPINSVLYGPICESISALSRASPTVPTEASMPASRRWAVNAKLVYRDPASVWCTIPPCRGPGPVPPPQRHVQGIRDQLGPLVRGGRPADDGTRVNLHHEDDIYQPGPGRNVSEIGHPPA